jgi:hypothetical protein
MSKLRKLPSGESARIRKRETSSIKSSRSNIPRKSSEESREASRKNGNKSRGPHTPEGKQKSRSNALTHGLTARSAMLLPTENPDDFSALQAGMYKVWQPQDDELKFWLDRLIDIQWRLARASRNERDFILRSQLEAFHGDYRQRLRKLESGEPGLILSSEMSDEDILRSIRDDEVKKRVGTMTKIEKDSLMIKIAMGQIGLFMPSNGYKSESELTLEDRAAIAKEEMFIRGLAAERVLRGSSMGAVNALMNDTTDFSGKLYRHQTGLMNWAGQVTAMLIKLKASRTTVVDVKETE